MAPNLYLLVSRSPPGATEGPYAPCRIKASKDPTTDPLVGFATLALGEEFMSWHRITDAHCQIVPFSALEPSVAARAREQAVLFFDSAESLARYVEDGPAISAILTRQFADAYALAQCAL